MKINPKITVAIGIRIRHQYLHQLLLDLKSQTIKPDQYLIVENVCEEQHYSQTKISNILKNNQHKYITTRGKNLAITRNICLKQATGDILVFIDDDVRVPKKSIELIKNAFQKYPQAVGFSTRTKHPKTIMFHKFNDYWYNRGCMELKTPKLQPLAVSSMTAFNLKTINKQQLTFDEKLNDGEDIDFFCLLQTKHLPLFYLPNITTNHFFGNRSNLKIYLKRFYQYGQGVALVSLKYPKTINTDWLIPNRKLDLILFPIFFLKNVIKQVILFKTDNKTFPINLYPLTFLVYCFFNLGCLLELNKTRKKIKHFFHHSSIY